jgi:hypothetical protein
MKPKNLPSVLMAINFEFVLKVQPYEGDGSFDHRFHGRTDDKRQVRWQGLSEGRSERGERVYIVGAASESTHRGNNR